MFSTSISTLALDVAFCEICSNYTPRVYAEEFQQECCEYCFDAYGECN